MSTLRRRLKRRALLARRAGRKLRWHRPNWLKKPRLLLKFRMPGRRLKLPYSLFAAEGRLEVRITRDRADIAAAQALRYRVFYEELGAKADAATARSGRDFDKFDAYCDHLLVIDHSRPRAEAVVGTYRLLRHEVALKHGGFYSAGEYDIMPLVSNLSSLGGMVEVGRSCVHKDYRTNWVIQLLWRGITGYIAAHQVKYLFGCASFAGTDVAKHALPLSHLYYEHLAPEHLRVQALPGRRVDMRILPPDAIDKAKARKLLPPLIKAYLRLGAFIGDGAVIDEQFGTTDVFIVLPIERVAPKYTAHFERNEIIAAS